MKHFVVFSLILFFVSGVSSQTRVVVDEDFSANHYSWKEEDKEGISTKISKGKFSLESTNDKSQWTFINTDLQPNEENFEIETSIELLDGPDNFGYGIVFGMYKDWSDYKCFYISSNGYYRLTHFYDNKSHTIIDWKKTDLVKKRGANGMKIRRNYNCIEFLLNDVVAFSHCEFKWHGSKFGYIVSAKQKISVDYLKITASPKPLPKYESSWSGFSKENIGELVNTKYDENSPVISPDGKTLYYCTYYNPENIGDPNKTDVYFSELNRDNKWGKYKSIGKPINNTASNWVISVSPDNNALVLGNMYKADGGEGGSGISISRRNTDNSWSVPQNQVIKNYRNDNKYVAYFISSDNKIMLIALEDGSGFGDNDICVSFLDADMTWSKPVNLGPVVNSLGSDFSPFLAADGKTLYYASYGHESFGSADIFMTRRLDDTWKNWSEPVNLGPSINTSAWESSFSISAKGDYAYMISNEGGIENSTDIFRIKLAESQRPEPVLMVYGKVLNKKTNQPLEADISYSDIKANKEIGIARSSPKDGSYKIVLPVGKNYGFLAFKQGFFPISQNINLDTLKNYLEIERNLFLDPAEVGSTILLNNIFFDNNQATLKDESNAELNRLSDFLLSNSGVRIEVAGHTDNVGSDDYNMKLSQQRTEAVVDYLIRKGVGKDRLSAKGYGETKPVEKNDTEENRAKNRRVEFSIKSK
jgi:OmpA-OmpF porin, OOP family